MSRKTKTSEDRLGALVTRWGAFLAFGSSSWRGCRKASGQGPRVSPWNQRKSCPGRSFGSCKGGISMMIPGSRAVYDMFFHFHVRLCGDLRSRCRVENPKAVQVKMQHGVPDELCMCSSCCSVNACQERLTCSVDVGMHGYAGLAS